MQGPKFLLGKKKRGGQLSDQPVAYCPARPPGFSSSSHMITFGSTFSPTWILHLGLLSLSLLRGTMD